MDIRNTKTLKNIEKAFAEDAKALVKYSFYAEIAKDEGKEDVAELYNKMAKCEWDHARIWYKLLNEGFDTTALNLETSRQEANNEWKSTYPKFAKQARKDGFESLASLFEQIASIECGHERKFLEAYLTLSNTEELHSSLKKVEEVQYYCIFCGDTEDIPLPVCPVCGAKDAFSE